MAEIGNIAKKFFINLGVGAATQIVRGYLNEQLRDIQPADLYDSIINDRDLWSVIPEDIKKTGRKFKKTYGKIFNKFENQINTELIFSWIKEDHTDLYSVILNTPNNKGIIWLDKQVAKIKQQILYM